MSQEEQIHNSVAPLANVQALTALIDRVQNRHPSLPGMAVFYGNSGYGKSTAAAYATVKYDAVTVEMASCWTTKNLCEAILIEMGVRQPRGTVSSMVNEINRTLAVQDRPLIVDEADFLVTTKKIEIVRDIHKGSGAPVILIGEELLPQKLKAWERVDGRMMDWVPAKEGTLKDAEVLAPMYAPGVTLEPELLARLQAASGGSIRRICINLQAVWEQARIHGRDRMGLEDWGRKAFFSGEPPAPRRAG